MESILTSVKKLLGIEDDCTHFDVDVIFGINTTFNIITQMGVGPENGFSITNKDSVWTDFIPDITKIELVKSYVYLKTRLLVDPPASSVLVDTINKQILEFEWRISTTV